jgi:hypothetical protein
MLFVDLLGGCSGAAPDIWVCPWRGESDVGLVRTYWHYLSCTLGHPASVGWPSFLVGDLNANGYIGDLPFRMAELGVAP